MTFKSTLSCFFAALFIVMLSPTAVAAEKKAVKWSKTTHVGRVVAGKPIELGIDNKGVKLESIAFSETEAVVIVWNRTPESVKGHVGLALYDKRNVLLAAESDSTSFTRTFTQIRSGKQATFKVSFDKFMTSMDGVDKYALVFVTQD